MKESISLRYKQGPSDKIYNATLEERADGWVVNFAYGRYGKALKSGTKTAAPISYERAKKAYDKLVNAKAAKGYSPDTSGTPFTAPQIDQERTDLYPQLLNEVFREDVPGVLERFGGKVLMQFKHDGERRPVRVTETEIYGSNRRALKVGLHPEIESALIDMRIYYPEGFTLDTEDMGNRLVIFDVLSVGDNNLRSKSFIERALTLESMQSNISTNNAIEFDIPKLYSSIGPLMLDINRAEAQGHEGVVLRDQKAQYSIGRPNSGGSCLKLKFWQSATCRVLSLHPTKRSIALELLDTDDPGVVTSPGWIHKGKWIPVGNCTVPTTHDIPNRGDLVEIKYMYAYYGGSIYQPQYKGVRTDLDICAAVLSRLKYKE